MLSQEVDGCHYIDVHYNERGMIVRVFSVMKS